MPVRTTVLGIATAVAALAAALSIGSSFDHLLRTPRLYGQAWDLRADNFGEGDFTEGAHTLADDPSLAALSYGDRAVLRIKGKGVEALALTPLSGDAFPPVVAGRRPDAAGEIALGVRTMRALQIGLGERIDVSLDGVADAPVRKMLVVGRIVAPVPTSGELGEFALVDYETGLPAFAEQDVEGAGIIMFRFAPGVDREEVLQRIAPILAEPDALEFVSLEGMFPRLKPPADVVNFGRVEDLPLIVGGAIGLLAAAVLVHMVSSSVRRRRRDIAIMKALGLGRRQVGAAVGWQATLLVSVALVFGLPAGVAAGRWAWIALAERVGVLAEPRVPFAELVIVIPAALLLANLVAAIPGRIAARTQPALVLRAE